MVPATSSAPVPDAESRPVPEAVAPVAPPELAEPQGEARDTYPDEAVAIAARARELRGPGKYAPGPKQAARVLEALDGRSPVVVVGLRLRALRRIADNRADTTFLREATGLREFGSRFDDRFCKGRSLAALLAAIAERRQPALRRVWHAGR